MQTSDFDYHLPPEFIAQTPIEPRDASRLMVLNRRYPEIIHSHFYHLADFLNINDVLVVNETRVIPARLYGQKLPTGGRFELLLLSKKNVREWRVLVGGKGIRSGIHLLLDGGLEAEIIEVLEGPQRMVRFDKPIETYLDKFGHTPLPPYIHVPLDNSERYQTIYARKSGSAAAPTAGLHFTARLIDELRNKGIRFVTVTLHVGLDTFAPVNEDSPEDHKIHSEWCHLSTAAAQEINAAHKAGGRVIAVGTTSVRTLESAAQLAQGSQVVGTYKGSTDLFILPGYQFRAVDALITNFHLPRSTLIMLVSAFAGRERILHAYQLAIQENYRFYSFGDAMLIF
jgi:S-adenosylmethionine:tRNA ribosyltransferase-isomerase